MSVTIQQREAVIRPGTQGRVSEGRGVQIRTVLSPAETGGTHGIIDYLSPPTGVGPALHLHREMEETFHILEGQMNFQVGQQRLAVPLGTLVHVPVETPHAFWNTGPKPVRMLITFSGVRLDEYLHGLLAIVQRHTTIEPELQREMEEWGKQYDTITLGPPPGLK